MFDSNGFRYGGFVLTALALIAAAYLALQGRWLDAAVMAGFVLSGVVLALWRDRLPSLFTFLFALAGAINAAGYAFNLWTTPAWFDEAVHVFTPFAIVSALAWVLVKRDKASPSERTGLYLLKIVLLGLAVGIAWEGFEWLIGIIGSTRDTLIDLAMDTLGAVLAALFCLWAAHSERTELAESPRTQR